MELSETLEKVRDSFLDKSAELQALQKKTDNQVRQWTDWGRNLEAV